MYHGVEKCLKVNKETELILTFKAGEHIEITKHIKYLTPQVFLDLNSPTNGCLLRHHVYRFDGSQLFE